MTSEQAYPVEQALADIEQVQQRTRQAVMNYGSDWLLMLWSVIWIVCYLFTQHTPQQAGWVWLIGNMIGIPASIAIGMGWGVREPMHGPATRRVRWQCFGSWLALFLFGTVWLMLLQPWNGAQLNAFIVTLIMFGFVMAGVWTRTTLFIVLGIFIALATVSGFWLAMLSSDQTIALPYIYGYWMALFGGGALLTAGLYMRLRWR